jgi:hypothetical protein
MKQLRRVVYTTLFGNYDSLCAPRIKGRGIDYIALVDSDDVFVPEGWQKRIVPNEQASAVKGQRYYKIWPYDILPGYDLYLYCDASYRIVRDLSPLFVGASGFMIKPHPKRDCVYHEGEAVIRLGKDTAMKVNSQLDEYRDAGMPEHFGCWESGILIRDCSEETKAICQYWWGEVLKYSHRDQLGLPFTLWATGIKQQNLSASKLALYFINQAHRPHIPKKPNGVRIWYLSPYAKDLNIGSEYNEQIAHIPKDDYVVILDQDVMFLHPKTKAQIQDIVNENKDYDLIGCMLSRIGSGNQCPGGKMSNDPNVLNHYRIAEELHDTKYGLVSPRRSGIAGAFMCFPKRTWDKVKFQENSIYFDTQFSKEVLKWGKIGLMEGVYLLHYYRLHAQNARDYKDHLIGKI